MDKPMKGKSKKLTPRQQRFVAAYLSGLSANKAAIQAGYPPASARTRGAELLAENELVKAEIAAATAEIRKTANWDAQRAMEELDAAIRLAENTKQTSTIAKCLELKMKLCGLLLEKNPNGGSASFSINIMGLDTPAPPVTTVEG